jgi:hypothetical protein
VPWGLWEAVSTTSWFGTCWRRSGLAFQPVTKNCTLRVGEPAAESPKQFYCLNHCWNGPSVQQRTASLRGQNIMVVLWPNWKAQFSPLEHNGFSFSKRASKTCWNRRNGRLNGTSGHGPFCLNSGTCGGWALE